MANRSNVMGLHGLKNHVSRNSFDLSHRNLFTAKVGELLPCFVQEVNPGDTIKLTSSYFTRTAPLQSAAFTRLRENIQFFFVPYSCLWKYFNGQVMNMTKNSNGGDISRIASGVVSDLPQTTQMPFINYSSLHSYLVNMINKEKVSPVTEANNPLLFINGCYRHAESAKLLQLLGYGNFQEQFMPLGDSKHVASIPSFKNSPNLSVFRLLAYQKICNDHYLYSQWQPYLASLCNIDYIKPSSTGNLSLNSYFTYPQHDLTMSKLNMLDMRFSNLPLDYFNGVLPTAQFGSESVVNLSQASVSGGTLNGTTSLQNDSFDYSQVRVDGSDLENVVNLDLSTSAYGILHQSGTSNSLKIETQHTHNVSGSFSGANISANLGIIALRNAIALQKYKEVQLAADADFVSQVEAHFGVKPHHESDKSVFIGGSSSMIEINPQVNQTLDNWNDSNFLKAAPSGSGSATMKFTADTYGVVIGIYRCTPVLDYAHVGIDRTLFKTDASDFVIPELDSIGMQQNYQCEVVAPSAIMSEFEDKAQDAYSLMDNSVTYGFAPRYSEYKTSYDRYNGAFCHSLKSWVTGLDLDKMLNGFTSSGSLGSGKYIYAPDMFVCRPDIVKSIFLLSDYHTSDDDNLYVGLVNMCYATRNLSVYGLPYSK